MVKPSEEEKPSSSSSYLARASRSTSEAYTGFKRLAASGQSRLPSLPTFTLPGSSSWSSGRSSHASTPATTPGLTTPVPAALNAVPPSHRERTALHALRDTFEFPSPSSFLPTLPTIPCMQGLGQSSLFHDLSSNPGGGGGEQETTSRTGSQDAFDKLDGNVLMLGGYRGSILRDAKTGRRLWVPLRVGVNVRKVDLAIGLRDEDELNSTDTVVPGKSLAAIAGFVDLGKRLKDKLKALDQDGQIKFHSFGYDWRRSLELSSKDLTDILEKMKAQTGRGTIVIAHSMGGLVALHALAKATDPTIFRGVIFGSTPFLGTANILQPFRWGDSILLNKDICSPSTVFSFRSSFYLLPPDGECFEDSSGNPRTLDFLQPEDWKKHGLSPMTAGLGQSSGVVSSGSERSAGESQAETRAEAREEAQHASTGGGPAPVSVEQMQGPPSSGPTPTTNPAHMDRIARESDAAVSAYLDATLARVRTFRRELATAYNPDKAHLYPPLIIIAGSHTHTVRGAIIDTDQELFEGQYDRLLFDNGDGIITHKSAIALPTPWTKHLQTAIESRHGHVSLLSDLKAIREALESIYAAERRAAINSA